MKDKTLSDKMIVHSNPVGFFEYEDVKEFIGKLKDKCKEHDIVKIMMLEYIDELAGDKLI